jgi:hypothetical protein
MGLYQSDVAIKTAIELTLEDMRKSPWLLDDIFSDFTKNPYLQKKYQTQIKNVKDWFCNNKIYVEMGYVTDGVQLPRISIVLGDQKEAEPMKTMGDASVDSVMLLPTTINQPIPFVVKPFTPVSYDAPSGALEVPDGLKGFNKVVSGQIVVNISSGKGFIIDDLMGDTILLAPGSVIGSGQLAVVPKFGYYEAKIEHTWLNSSYQIICTAMGDAQTLIWLHDIVLYGLFRYRQGLIEDLGLYESLINSGPLTNNPDMTDNGQIAWERTITISGKTEATFIKAPHRLVEDAEMLDNNPDNSCCPPDSGFIGGIKIASNSEPLTRQEEENSLWEPIDDENP